MTTGATVAAVDGPAGRYAFHTLDVFTDSVHGGNQLAVVPDARGLTAAQMQSVAREFNFSETVFVLPATDARHTRRLRIFTPRVELPFAGHPTIGTAHLLAALGEIPRADETRIVFEEGVGPVPVVVKSRGGLPTFAQLSAAQLPQAGPHPPPPRAIAEAISLAEGDVGLGTWEPAGLSCGVPFLFVPLRNVAAVSRAQLDRQRWREHLADWWSPHVCVFAPDPAHHDAPTLRARVFTPAAGIEEDPATGGAAVALAGYLAARDATTTGRLRWVVHQGVEMGRPSVLYLEADKSDGLVTATRVGGAAVRVSEGTMSVPALPG